jgi:hypothetical protein
MFGNLIVMGALALVFVVGLVMPQGRHNRH